MTAPTPEGTMEPTQARRLRNIAVAMTTQGRLGWATDVLIAADALAAVTAERDQAIRNLCDDGPCPVEDLHRDAVIRAVAAERELAQASQKLADAPHGASCTSGRMNAMTRTAYPCSCWKAGL